MWHKWKLESRNGKRSYGACARASAVLSMKVWRHLISRLHCCEFRQMLNFPRGCHYLPQFLIEMDAWWERRNDEVFTSEQFSIGQQLLQQSWFPRAIRSERDVKVLFTLVSLNSWGFLKFKNHKNKSGECMFVVIKLSGRRFRVEHRELSWFYVHDNGLFSSQPHNALFHIHLCQKNLRKEILILLENLTRLSIL